MQTTSVVQHSHLSVPKQKRNLCGTDNEYEYEVERICVRAEARRRKEGLGCFLPNEGKREYIPYR
jgi:hypothetical protein